MAGQLRCKLNACIYPVASNRLWPAYGSPFLHLSCRQALICNLAECCQCGNVANVQCGYIREALRTMVGRARRARRKATPIACRLQPDCGVRGAPALPIPHPLLPLSRAVRACICLVDSPRWNRGAAERCGREDWLGARGAARRAWRRGCGGGAARDDSIAPHPPRRRKPGVRRRNAHARRRPGRVRGTDGRDQSPWKCGKFPSMKGEAEARAHGRRSGRG